MRIPLLRSSAALLGAALAACSGGSGPAAPKLKDTYVHASISDIDSLDPAWSYDTASHYIIAQIYEPLVDYKGSSVTELEPRVAEAVPTRENGLVSRDNRTYTFPIRKGVRFHEGGEVAPEDVRYSLMRFMLLDRASGPSSLLLEPVTGLTGTRKDGKPLDEAYDKVAAAVRVEGDNVVLTLHKPFAPILTVLASWAPVLSKSWCAANGEWDGTKEAWKRHNNPDKTASALHERANGTGPFRLERWDHRSKEIVLGRHDGYWRGPAKLKRAVIKGIDEFQTRKLMLAAGDADSIYADYLQQPLLQSLPGVQIIDDLPRLDMNPTVFFTFKIRAAGNPNVGSGRLDGRGIPPDFFSDRDVRLAFAHAFDYDGFIRDVNRGKGSRATSFIPKGLLGHDPDVPLREYDLAKAEAHFKKAWGGRAWEKGFQFTIAYNAGNQPREVIANMIKRAVESVNPRFKIDTRPIQWSTFLDQYQKSMLPIFIMGWAPDYPDPHTFAFPFMHSKGNFPETQGYRNPEADRLVSLAVAEIDPAKREALYKRLQRVAYEDVPTLFILNSVRYRTQRSWVKGFVYNPVHPDSPYAAPLYGLSKG